MQGPGSGAPAGRQAMLLDDPALEDDGGLRDPGGIDLLRLEQRECRLQLDRHLIPPVLGDLRQCLCLGFAGGCVRPNSLHLVSLLAVTSSFSPLDRQLALERL